TPDLRSADVLRPRRDVLGKRPPGGGGGGGARLIASPGPLGAGSRASVDSVRGGGAARPSRPGRSPRRGAGRSRSRGLHLEPLPPLRKDARRVPRHPRRVEKPARRPRGLRATVARAAADDFTAGRSRGRRSLPPVPAQAFAGAAPPSSR